MSASAPSGVLPEDAKLVVTPIVNDGNDSLYEDTSDRLKEQAEKDKQTVDAFIAYDIQFEKDGKEVEPDDGKVTVTMKWDSAVKPEGVQGDEKISVVHLKDEKTVENLSKEKDTNKNHASVETDDNDSEALTKAEITSDSFSVYAVEWTIDNVSSITVHYIDENGNEISPADTVNAPADAGADTLAKAIDGYAYASATVDQVNATELKTENGRLSFNDGTNWNQASSTDVYLTYTAVPAEETAAPEESTEAPAETTEPEVTAVPEETAEPENVTGGGTPAPETTPSSEPSVTEASEISLNAATKDNKYNVTVTYGEDAGLPDGTKLTVKTISSDNDEYENAKNAVAASRKVDADTLGMTALDITLTDKDGKKVEPKDHSKVKVSINAVGLPSEAESIDIHHITENNAESSNPVSNALNSIVRFSKKVFTGTTDQAEEVKKNVAVTDGQAVADFEVSSFSTFTITWTKGDGTRTGNVVIHYVKDTGLEKDVTDASLQNISVSDLMKYNGGIVDLTSTDSPWTSKVLKDDTDENGKVTASYTYDHAVIGTKDGQTITGVKVDTGTETVRKQTGWEGNYPEGHATYSDVNVETYQLYYTTDETVSENSKWIAYKDSASGSRANNADVYLIYSSLKDPVTVHFLELDGTPIDDSEGNAIVKKFDGASHTSEYDLSTYATANAPTGYTFSTNSMNTDVNHNRIMEGKSGGSQTIGTITGEYYRYLKYEDNKIRLARGNKQYADATEPLELYITYTKVQTYALSKITFHHVDKYGAQLTGNTTRDTGTDYENKWNGFSTVLTGNSSEHQSGIGTYQKSYVGYFGDDNYSNVYGENQLYTGLSYRHDNNGWHTAISNSATVAPGGNNPGKELYEKDSANTPVLLTDVYQVYTGEKGVTIHYVDSDGNEIKSAGGVALSSGADFKAADHTAAINGYTFKEARAGSVTGNVFTDIVYTQSGDDWTSTVTNNEESVSTDTNPVNDVYLIYRTGESSKTLTAHYVYANDKSDAYYRDDNGTKHTSDNTSLKVLASGETPLVRHQDGYDYVYETAVREGQIKRTGKTDAASDDIPLTFSTARLASPDGPTVTSVELNDNGQLVYHTELTSGGWMSTNSTTKEWTYTETNGAQNGRRFVITEDSSGNPTLVDSQNGTFELNYASEAAGSEDDGTHQEATFTATYKGVNITTEYTVNYKPPYTDSNGTYHVSGYSLNVKDSFPSDNTDIYYLYTDAGDENGLWIDNDILYSGLFRAKVSDSVQNDLNNATNISYSWYQIKVPRNTEGINKSYIDSNPGTEVIRKQTGQHWNTANNASDRTYLDIEADEGTDTWTSDNDIYYYVTLQYTTKDGISHTQTSVPVLVGYYGQLENGSFESPTSYNGQQIGAGTWSNEEYKAMGGIWQTTGTGYNRTTTTGKVDPKTHRSSINTEEFQGTTQSDDIEIVDGTNHMSLNRDYHWQNGNGSEKSWAAAGDRFAELNAAAAGALYQDVITHPNEELSYKFSHRARGSSEADRLNYKYDTMYLVIMPTKLAMTAGDNNTELRTQAELQKFIQKHGGFDSSTATSEQDEVTYNDVTNGILIRKVSSDENDWHTIDVKNGYTAKGGLTRFFYVAASTAGDLGRNQAHNLSDPPTQGNFIDNVSFSQVLPNPDGFSLVVSKTFTGLTQTQVASLASSTTANGTTTTNKKPFTFTITNTYNTNSHNAALQDAILRFTATQTGANTYTFTPTAVQYTNSSGTPVTAGTEGATENDLLTEKDSNGNLLNSAVAKVNTDGSVTMTWTFTDQKLASEATDQSFNYRVKETNNEVDGYTVVPTVSATTGQTWRQIAAAHDNGTTITTQGINGAEPGLVDVDTSIDYTPNENNCNVMVGQLSNGARTGYLVWTHTTDSPNDNQALKNRIIAYINTLSWAINAPANSAAGYGQNGHVEFVSGGNNGQPFVYDRNNPSLTISYVMGSDNRPAVRLANAITETLSSDDASITRPIRQSYIGRYNFTNEYREKTVPQITVQKVFTGVTRTTVDDLLKNGYQITLTKTQDDAGNTITEPPTMVLNSQTSSSNSNVSYSAATDESSGRITLTWTIREAAGSTGTGNDTWIGGPGTYSVSEEKFNTTKLDNDDNNVLQYVEVNDQSVSFQTTDTDIAKSDIHVGEVGSTDYSPTITVKKDADEKNLESSSSSIASGNTVKTPDGTNLIIAKTDSTNGDAYVVWTSGTAGVNLRQAVLKKIQSVWSDNTVTLDKISFRSGSNPGEMEYDNSHSGTTMTYNSSNNELAFVNESSVAEGVTPVKWTGYYAVAYTLSSGSDSGMTTTDTEIRISNSYDPLVKIKKVSETLDGSPLGNAKFRLYKLDSNGNKFYYTTKSTPTEPDFRQVDTVDKNTSSTRIGTGSSEVKALSFTSGANDGMVTIGALTRDKDTNGKHTDTIYYLEEYEAPAGYHRVLIPFRVRKDGTVQLVGSKVDGKDTYVTATNDAQISWDDPYYMLTIRDTAGTALPNTGGIGVWPFIFTGFALIMFASYLLWRRRRSKLVEEKLMDEIRRGGDRW